MNAELLRNTYKWRDMVNCSELTPLNQLVQSMSKGSVSARSGATWVCFCLIGLFVTLKILFFSGAFAQDFNTEYYNANSSPQNLAWDLGSGESLSATDVLAALNNNGTVCNLGGWYLDSTGYNSQFHWTVYTYLNDASCTGTWTHTVTGAGQADAHFCDPGYRWYVNDSRSCLAGYYVSVPPTPPSLGECDCTTGKVAQGEPIEPGSGNESEQEVDYSSGDRRLALTRTYNSQDPTASASFGQTWTSSYTGRRILPADVLYPTQVISSVTNPYAYYLSSTTYQQAQDACITGWATIAAANPAYASVTAVSYSPTTNVCTLSNGQSIPVYSTAANALYVSTGITGDIGVQRQDGSLYLFDCTAGTCTSTANARLQLTASVNGYTLINENSEVEQYDSNGVLDSVTSPSGYKLTYTYNAGQLFSIIDTLGRSLSFSNYTSASNVQIVTTPDGSIHYSYDGMDRLAGVSFFDRNGDLVGSKQYQYQDPTHLLALTGIIDENQQLFVAITYDPTTGFASNSALGGFTSNGGFGVMVTSVKYTDPNNTAINTLNPEVTDAFGIQRIYHYSTINGQPELTSISGSVCNSCEAPMSASYDSAGYHSSQIDWNGNQTTYTFDDLDGLELLRTEAANDSSATPATRTIKTTWNTAFRKPTEIDEYNGGSSGGNPIGTLLRTTKYGLDGLGNVTSKTIIDESTGKSRTWSFQNYTSWGTPQTIVGPRIDVPDTTQITYYTSPSATCSGSGCQAASCTATSCPVGQIYTATNPLGETVIFGSYDGSGRPLTITDANGVQTTLTYYPRGWLNTMTVGSNQSGGGRKTTYKYWPTGQIQEIDYPIGAVRSFFYNAAHQLTDIYDLPVTSGGLPPTGADRINYTPDAMGNVTGINVYSSTGGNNPVETHTTTYNSLNQLQKDIGAYSGETTQYVTYNDGQIQQITDPLTHVTNFTLDALNRVKAVIDPNQYSSNFGNQATTSLGLNALNQLVSVIDPRGLITGYSVDALGEVSQIVSPDTETTQQTTFDGDGNPTTRTDANGDTRKMQYDALDRVAQVLVYDPRNNLIDTITLAYDQTDSAHGFGIGHLTNVADTESGTALNFTWNAWGELVQKQETVNNQTLTTKWAYSPTTGQLIRMTLPSLAYVGYNWGSGTTGGLITGMALNGSALISNISYFPFSGPIQWTLAQEGNHIDERDYDLDGRIATDPVENIYFDAPSSRVKSWTLASQSGSGTVSFSYQDPMDWVAGYSDGTTTLGYHYDANANRNVATVNSVKTTYVVDSASNKLNRTTTGSNNTIFSYDNDGSRTATGTTTWGYDANEHLVSANGGTYQYDGLGERVYKKLQLITLFNYDPQGQLIGEYRTTGAAVEEMVYLGNMPVATLLAGSATGGTLYYIHADYRNTPRQIDNLSGAPVWAWTPQPYGENQPNSNPSGLGTFTYNLRYPGQYYDAESGLTYNMARTYDAATGRYLQSDPIGLHGGINTYAYTEANPLNGTDPTGLTIYYANHPVVGDIYHSKIVIIPDDQAAYANDPRFQLNDQGQYSATIGAGPQGFPWQLVAGVDRSRDVSQPCDNATPLDLPPIYPDENAAIDNLFGLANDYNQNPENYGLFPTDKGSYYNSNSFVNGLLNAGGFDPPGDTGAYTPGYNKPVPGYRF